MYVCDDDLIRFRFLFLWIKDIMLYMNLVIILWIIIGIRNDRIYKEVFLLEGF